MRILHEKPKEYSSLLGFNPDRVRWLTGLTGAPVHPGSWFGLPDFGVSEFLQGTKSTSPTPSSTYKAPVTQKVAPPAPTYNTGGSNVPSAPIPQGQSQQPYQQIQTQQDNGNAQIEADYNQSMGMLGNAESGLQQSATNAGNVIDTGAADTTNQLQNSQALGEQGVQSTVDLGQAQAKTAGMQARDVYRQTQQANSAQLSALGISSSSVTEALAEKLGVETARRIAGVTDSLSSLQLNAKKELTRISTYYTGQKDTLAKHVGDQKATIQSSLIQGLNQINSARSQAASDKSSARANLLSQTQTAIYNLTTQQQAFQQSLDQWAAQKSAALTPIVQDPNYVNNIIAQSQNLTSQYQTTAGLSGYTATPSFNYDKNGNITGQISTNKPVTNSGLSNEDPNNPGFDIFGNKL